MRIFYLPLILWFCSCRTQTASIASPEIEQLLNQGFQLSEERDYNNAEACFETAYELGAGALALDALGSVAFATHKLEKAELLFKKAIQENPKMSIARTHLAYIYEIQGRNLDASEEYTTAIKLEPKNYMARNNLAALHFDKHKHINLKKAILFSKKEIYKAYALNRDPIIENNLKLLNNIEE
jgi:tetratricopeptide (TPR) repeat protein